MQDTPDQASARPPALPEEGTTRAERPPQTAPERGAERAEEPSAQQVAADLSAVVSRLTRRLRTASPESLLTPSQRSVLVRLDAHGPATTAALARAEYVRPQSMRTTLGVLEEQGFVQRSPDPSDGRQSVVSLTDSGLRTLDAVRAAKHGWLSAALAAQYDTAELGTLAEAIALLERLVGR